MGDWLGIIMFVLLLTFAGGLACGLSTWRYARTAAVTGKPAATDDYTTTNLATPATLWMPIQTNRFDQYGVFEYTNAFNPAEHQRFFLLSHP